ncbi:hypothetical protein TYRP_009201 [Tyrophagus putrescentiae]|nr:hypothetical protein TYRP_009201 [Tyrophagus putrescentiae]
METETTDPPMSTAPITIVHVVAVREVGVVEVEEEEEVTLEQRKSTRDEVDRLATARARHWLRRVIAGSGGGQPSKSEAFSHCETQPTTGGNKDTISLPSSKAKAHRSSSTQRGSTPEHCAHATASSICQA